MENNRRAFFKGLATFVSGVAAAKAASYIPKKEEPKEELMVSSALTITHEGEQYHPLVVKKTTYDGMESIPMEVSQSFTVNPSYKHKIREAKI